LPEAPDEPSALASRAHRPCGTTAEYRYAVGGSAAIGGWRAGGDA